MNAPRPYVDEDAAEHAIVDALRQRGINVLTAHEAGTLQLDDASQLRFAAENDRTLYSLNVRDFTRLHQEFAARGEPHAGIILIPRQRYSIGEKARRLQELLDTIEAAALGNSLYFV